MFLPLARPVARPLAFLRLSTRAPNAVRGYASTPTIDKDIRNLLEAEKLSRNDPDFNSEADSFLNSPPPPVPGESNLDRDGNRIHRASVLDPPKVARSSKELFGTQQRATLQTLPNGFNTRSLPLRGPLPEDCSEIQFASTVVHGRSIHRPFRHPRTHGLPAAQIQFRSHDPLMMSLFVHFATHAAYSLGIPCSRMYSLPTQRTLWTVPRGPFVHKKSQENFERKVHRRGISAWDADPHVVDLWFKYLRRHAMGGVGMRCVKWERLPMGVGKKMLAQVEHGLNNSDAKTSKSRIQSMGDKIVAREMGVARKSSDNVKTVEHN
ncbi:unnamed protein product [Mycena citricolor]|uniref:Small ribosomal subunit protein uS10 domain-containing protein n=1 Tax=Mycena citricolor TaxID=2018698 RepID=A0AAD2JV61_9AGAR|nr:unnamed protein product [Mycena citricolor]